MATAATQRQPLAHSGNAVLCALACSGSAAWPRSASLRPTNGTCSHFDYAVRRPFGSSQMKLSGASVCRTGAVKQPCLGSLESHTNPKRERGLLRDCTPRRVPLYSQWQFNKPRKECGEFRPETIVPVVGLDGPNCFVSRHCNISAPALPARSSRPSQRECEEKCPFRVHARNS